MDLEREVFKNRKLNPDKLEEYGFEKIDNCYRFSKMLMEGFKVDISVDEKGKVEGHIYDMDTEEEYSAFRIESMNGEFVGRVRDEYNAVLKDISTSCFSDDRFLSAQANRLVNTIKEVYGDKPEFLWNKLPDVAVFRNPVTAKWYGVIMNIEKRKLDSQSERYIDVLNVKLDPKDILDLHKKKGMYPAYHMNKKYWVTIVLDDTIEDEEILSYIEESYGYASKKK